MKKNLKKYLPRIVWSVSFVLEMALAATLIYFDLLPSKYNIVIIIILLLFAFITSALLLFEKKRTGKKMFQPKQIFGMVLAAAISVVSIFGSVVLLQVRGTMDTIVANHSGNADAVLGVYVMAEDAATDISDAKAYNFGLLSNYIQKRNETAVSMLEDELTQDITTTPIDGAINLAAALYGGQINAIVIDEAYVSLITESPDDETESAYSNFDNETRLLFEIEINDEKEEKGQTQNKKEERVQHDVTTDPFIVYISGSDTRTKKLAASRSDVNILAEVNPVTHEIIMINTPRDYYVANPVGGGAMDKLTHCGLVGINNSEEALEDLYGVQIDRFVQVNFTGFENLIDMIGGITVESKHSFTSTMYGGTYSFSKGENYLTGASAIAFVRERYEVAGGDLTRGENQMAVIKAVINKVTSGSSDVLKNYTAVLKSLEGMFSTDFTDDEISSLVKMQLDGMPSWNIHSFGIMGPGGSDSTYSNPGVRSYVMYQDADMISFASDLLQKVANGERLSDDDVIYAAGQ